MTWLEILLAVLVVAAGSAVQAAIGFGLAMIAAPLLLLLDPAFVPGPMIAVALVLSLWMAWQERGAIDLSTFRVALLGRLVGTPPAALLLGTMSAATFDLIFGVLILTAVALSLVHSNLQPTPRNVFIATTVSGFMGTISSVGGPPIALVYQNAQGPSLRANLALLFVVGTSLSLVSLYLIGRFGMSDLWYSLWLLAGVWLGLLCGRPLRQHLDRGRARPWLLGLCAMSACGVLARALINLS